MKKNKNEAAAEKKTKPAEENIQTTEKIRSGGNSDGELTFKKVLYGFDPDEVTSFISEMREAHENSARIHESKLSSLKEELLLSNRERDSYGEELKKIRGRADAPSKHAEQSKDNSAEYEAEIALLTQKLERAEAEILRIKEENKKPDGKDEKISALKAENRELSALSETLRRENAELLAAAQRYDSLFEEHTQLMKKAEKLGSDLGAKSDEADGLKAELENKIEEITNLIAENGETARKSAELEVRNGVLNRQVAEYEALVQRLQEESKAQAHESAEKISALESEHAKSRLDAQKETQLREYYISRAELTLSELTKQIEQIRQSLGGAQGE